MTEHLPTRRMVLMGMAAASALDRGATADSSPSSVHWMSAVDIARLIRARKLSAREALAEHLKQIEGVNPKVNAIVIEFSDITRFTFSKELTWPCKGLTHQSWWVSLQRFNPPILVGKKVTVKNDKLVLKIC